MAPTITRPPEKPPAPDVRASMAQQMVLAVELPFILVASVAAGGGIGYWLDGRLHSSPIFLLLLGALGLAGGMRDVVRRLARSGSGRAS